MQQHPSKKLPFISDEDHIIVPFNYRYLEFSEEILRKPGERIDVVNGRHPEKTFVLETIQNPQASKIYLHKPISRYEVKI